MLAVTAARMSSGLVAMLPSVGSRCPDRLDSDAMSTLSRDEVARVAGLARIDLTPAELDRLAGELDVIVESVARVSEIATPDVPATSHPLPLTNVFRPDVPVEPVDRDLVLAAAPAARSTASSRSRRSWGRTR